MLIQNGKLIQTVTISSGEFVYAVETQYWLEFQLYDETGAQATGSYRGQGVVRRGENGRHYALIGDLDRPDAFVSEYLLDENATAESLARLQAFEDGFRAGANTRKRAPRTAKPDQWMDGFRAGREARKVA